MKVTHEQMNEYLDFYEMLLTDKQKIIMHYYFRDDYSLSEIASNLEVTRSAVQDTIRKVSKILENYEDKLHLIDKYHKRMKLYDILDKCEDQSIKNLKQRLIANEEESYE